MEIFTLQGNISGIFIPTRTFTRHTWPKGMVTDVLWTAVVWTLKGLLCMCRFFWVSPYHAINSSPKGSYETSNFPEEKQTTAGPQKKGRPERSNVLHTRLSAAEEEIHTLKSQIAGERVSWEKRFIELQRRQQDLRDQLVSETLTRPCVFLREDVMDVSGDLFHESEVEKNGLRFEEKDQECSSGMQPFCPVERTDLRPLKRHDFNSSVSGSQVSSTSAFGSRSPSVSTSAGSWRSGGRPHRVFVPHSPLDLRLGHRVRVLLPSGQISTGSLRYVGHLESSEGFYLGVELEQADHGQQTGVHQGHCYFECKPGHGAFVSFNKLLMAWE
ncbi:uncharacterized protein LOC114790919 isoform X2 [Denticeps clupeoides]|uniref:uncharacterized protein LOC114790919 isoform X2 n=1 Tax=Denticeps clupeoides TaxID=299321 RepID=UPI0010A475B9|nr:uncharacterized protein LOC114790919 isoform X2 [Denticeps clupeoides]